jgi:hypothetical protein
MTKTVILWTVNNGSANAIADRNSQQHSQVPGVECHGIVCARSRISLNDSTLIPLMADGRSDRSVGRWLVRLSGMRAFVNGNDFVFCVWQRTGSKLFEVAFEIT